jgi:hypothetical protein
MLNPGGEQLRAEDALVASSALGHPMQKDKQHRLRHWRGDSGNSAYVFARVGLIIRP